MKTLSLSLRLLVATTAALALPMAAHAADYEIQLLRCSDNAPLVGYRVKWFQNSGACSQNPCQLFEGVTDIAGKVKILNVDADELGTYITATKPNATVGSQPTTVPATLGAWSGDGNTSDIDLTYPGQASSNVCVVDHTDGQLFKITLTP